MNTTVNILHVPRNQELQGQIVVVIGGSAGIGLETARQAAADGAKVILTARSPKSLHRAATEVNAISSMACDATNPGVLGQFSYQLPIRRVVEPADVASLAPHNMINTALTGATYRPAVRCCV